MEFTLKSDDNVRPSLVPSESFYFLGILYIVKGCTEYPKIIEVSAGKKGTSRLNEEPTCFLKKLKPEQLDFVVWYKKLFVLVRTEIFSDTPHIFL